MTPLYYTENFLVPFLGNSKLIMPPPFCPAPNKVISEHSLLALEPNSK